MLKLFKKLLPIAFIILISFRDIIALYTTEYIKILPDLLIIAFFLYTIIKNHNNLNISKSDIILFCLLSVCIFSSAVNSVNFINFIFQIRSITIIYLLYFSIKNTSNEITYKNIIYTLCFISITLTIFAIIEVSTEKMLFFPSQWSENIIYASNFRRAYSLLNNPNTFSAFVILSYIILDLQPAKNKFSKKLDIIMLLVTILVIIISASRSGLAIFAIYLIYKIASKKLYKDKQLLKKIRIPVLGIIIVIFLSLITSSFIYKSQNISTNKQGIPIISRVTDIFSGRTIQTNIIDGRIYKITKAIEAFKDSPIIGSGLGSFGSSGSMRTTPNGYQKYNLDEKFYADNQYIVIFVETGILGAIIFIFFILNFVKDNKTARGTKLIIVILSVLGLFYNILEVLPLTLISILIIFSTKMKNA